MEFISKEMIEYVGKLEKEYKEKVKGIYKSLDDNIIGVSPFRKEIHFIDISSVENFTGKKVSFTETGSNSLKYEAYAMLGDIKCHCFVSERDYERYKKAVAGTTTKEKNKSL